MAAASRFLRPPGGSRRIRIALIALLVLVLVAGVGVWFVRAQFGPGAPVAGATEIAVRDNRFDPPAVSVPVGTDLTWNWKGEDEHNVVGDGFGSPTQASGTFVHAFAAPGGYEYRCTLHIFMRGEVVVTP